MLCSGALHHHESPPFEMPDASLQQIEFERQFRGHNRDDFQSWFAGVVKLLHPGGDLQRVRVTRGDGGLDCVSVNRGRVYQCYAPARIDEMRDAETAGKIRGDFAGALATVGEALNEWVFVHNHPESQLGHLSTAALMEIKAAHPSITLLAWGRVEFWAELFRLPKLTLAQVFGNNATQVVVVAVNLDDLQRVIARLEASPFPLELRTPEMPDLRKLEFNDLTGAVQASLHTGRMLDKKWSAFSQAIRLTLSGASEWPRDSDDTTVRFATAALSRIASSTCYWNTRAGRRRKRRVETLRCLAC
jgi:hypothetical protein